LQKRPDPVLAFLAVHVCAIVRRRVEGDEVVAGALGPLGQIGVEHGLPGFGVHAGGVGEHAVEVEQAGAHFFWQTQTHRRSSLHGLGGWLTDTTPPCRPECRQDYRPLCPRTGSQGGAPSVAWRMRRTMSVGLSRADKWPAPGTVWACTRNWRATFA